MFTLRNSIRSKVLLGLLPAIAVGAAMTASLNAVAQDKTAPAVAQDDPARIDRDGKKVCGFDLMTESERAGFKSQMYFTKDLKDRDLIRSENCARMKKRAAEKGVKLDE